MEVGKTVKKIKQVKMSLVAATALIACNCNINYPQSYNLSSMIAREVVKGRKNIGFHYA